MSDRTLTTEEFDVLRELIAARREGVGTWWPKWGPTVVTLTAVIFGAITFGNSLDKRLALQESAQVRMQDDIKELTQTVKALAALQVASGATTTRLP